MFVRKDNIRTVDEYIKDCERMKYNTVLGELRGPELDAMINYAENLKHSEYEYVWVDRS